MERLNKIAFERLFLNSSQDFRDEIRGNVLYKSIDHKACENWIESHREDSKEYLWYLDGDDSKFRVIELPNETDEVIRKYQNISNNDLLASIQRGISSISFWVKFWSIFTLISIVVGAIVLLLTL
jgi:hypothetical protein